MSVFWWLGEQCVARIWILASFYVWRKKWWGLAINECREKTMRDHVRKKVWILVQAGFHTCFMTLSNSLHLPEPCMYPLTSLSTSHLNVYEFKSLLLIIIKEGSYFGWFGFQNLKTMVFFNGKNEFCTSNTFRLSQRIFGKKRKMNKNNSVLTRRRWNGLLKIKIKLWLSEDSTEAEILKNGFNWFLHLGYRHR